MVWWVAVVVATIMALAPERVQRFEPGSLAQERWLLSTAKVKVWSSLVGAGKSWATALDAHVTCVAIPGAIVALTRLERASMDESTLVPLREKIITPEHWAWGWREAKGQLLYPKRLCDDGVTRQSKIAVFGWLDPSRELSTEFWKILVDQAEQLERRHYAIMITRLRQFDPWMVARAEAKGMRHGQLGLVCNPEDPEHWIAQEFNPDGGMRIERDAEGKQRFEVILSQESDNLSNLPPDYRSDLEALKGTVWYERLAKGKWVRAEGSVFTMWNPARDLIDPPAVAMKWGGYPPPQWPRVRGIDFGYGNPSVCTWWANDPETDEWHRYRVIYRSGMLDEDLARAIVAAEERELVSLRAAASPEQTHELRAYLGELNVMGSYADHDAQGRATIERYGVWTQPAKKDKSAGIQHLVALMNRGKMKLWRNALVEACPILLAKRLPTCLEQEIPGFRHKRVPGRQLNPSDVNADLFVDMNDHEIDASYYALYSHEQAPSARVFGSRPDDERVPEDFFS